MTHRLYSAAAWAGVLLDPRVYVWLLASAGCWAVSMWWR